MRFVKDQSQSAVVRPFMFGDGKQSRDYRLLVTGGVGEGGEFEGTGGPPFLYRFLCCLYCFIFLFEGQLRCVISEKISTARVVRVYTLFYFYNCPSEKGGGVPI